MTMKRRDMLKALGALVGSAGAAKLLSACGSDDPGGEQGITTFVYLMMENRSYDHYLGSRTLEGKPGDGLVAGMSNPTNAGGSEDIWVASEDTMCILDPPHGWTSSRNQFNAGANDGFARAFEAVHGAGQRGAMQYMMPSQVPIHTALADAYTVCDRWFCSVMGPTLPNRAFWHAGQSLGAKTNDAVLAADWSTTPTLYHRLDDAGVDWAYYYGDAPVIGILDGAPLGDGRLRRFNWDFFDDAAAGNLPPVVYIDPAFSSNDDHPPHHPLLGQQLIAAVYNVLATSPQWNNCMLVVTYDEHGGFYDHVPPPLASDDRANEGFDQLGFRVPTLVAGPYVKQSYVSSVVYDHASAIKHLDNVFGLESLTMRTAAANDLTDCIDMERLAANDPAPPISLPAVDIDESQLPDHCRGNSISFGPPTDHDILIWAEQTNKLGKYDLRSEVRDYTYNIGDYLDRHGLGRIRRGR